MLKTIDAYLLCKKSIKNSKIRNKKSTKQLHYYNYVLNTTASAVSTLSKQTTKMKTIFNGLISFIKGIDENSTNNLLEDKKIYS